MSNEIVPSITFCLRPLAAVGNGEIDEPLPQNVWRAINAVTTALACGEITPGEVATIARVYETFIRTAGIGGEKVVRDNLLRILTTGQRGLRPVDGTGRRPPARQFVEESLFNLEEKFCCRFAAGAASGIAMCNSWLIARPPARGIATRVRRCDRQVSRCGGGSVRRHRHRLTGRGRLGRRDN
jgi:hypothetical protein